MNTITDAQITSYVEAHIGAFHDKRLEALNRLALPDLLVKNPYLFRSKNLVIASDLVKSLLDTYLSSQEETLFGDFLEGLAIYVAEQVHNGLKSGATGIDLEFVKGGARYIVSIKSGPNWGNSSQVDRMKDNFTTAARIIRQGNATTNVIAINGCCYGRDANPDKGGYFKYCGQDFGSSFPATVSFTPALLNRWGITPSSGTAISPSNTGRSSTDLRRSLWRSSARIPAQSTGTSWYNTARPPLHW